MKREDIPADALLFADRIDNADAYLYFAREWSFEGSKGNDGRTAVVLFSRSPDQTCRRFGAVHFWVDRNRATSVRQVTLFDDALPCATFDRSVQRLVAHGILEIADQHANYSTAHFFDRIGVKVSPKQQNWYALVGPEHHTDLRHEKYILPFFTGKLGLEPYLRPLNLHQI